jgi:hypothetical protein
MPGLPARVEMNNHESVVGNIHSHSKSLPLISFMDSFQVSQRTATRN